MSRESAATSRQTPAQWFGQTVLQLRLEAGLSQEQLAAEAGLNVGTVRSIERSGGRAIMPDTYWALRFALRKRLGPLQVQRLEDAWSALVASQQPMSTDTDSTVQQVHRVPESDCQAVQAAIGPAVNANYYVGQFIDRLVIAPSTFHRLRRRWKPSVAGSVALMMLCLLTLPLALLPQSQARGAHGHPAAAAQSGQQATESVGKQQVTLDGWTFVAVPYGPASAHSSAIAALNTHTGEQEQILTPQPGYTAYVGALWSPSRHQLYYIAEATGGSHEVWETSLTDHGPAQPPSPSGERPFVRDCGATCTSLAWSADGQWLIFAGPDGPLREINLETAEQRQVVSGGAAPGGVGAGNAPPAD